METNWLAVVALIMTIASVILTVKIWRENK